MVEWKSVTAVVKDGLAVVDLTISSNLGVLVEVEAMLLEDLLNGPGWCLAFSVADREE